MRNSTKSSPETIAFFWCKRKRNQRGKHLKKQTKKRRIGERQRDREALSVWRNVHFSSSSLCSGLEAETEVARLAMAAPSAPLRSAQLSSQADCLPDWLTDSLTGWLSDWLTAVVPTGPGSSSPRKPNRRRLMKSLSGLASVAGRRKAPPGLLIAFWPSFLSETLSEPKTYYLMTPHLTMRRCQQSLRRMHWETPNPWFRRP